MSEDKIKELEDKIYHYEGEIEYAKDVMEGFEKLLNVLDTVYMREHIDAEALILYHMIMKNYYQIMEYYKNDIIIDNTMSEEEQKIIEDLPSGSRFCILDKEKHADYIMCRPEDLDEAINRLLEQGMIQKLTDDGLYLIGDKDGFFCERTGEAVKGNKYWRKLREEVKFKE